MAQSNGSSLLSMGPIIFGSKLKVIEWFQVKGLIPATKICVRCTNNQVMILTEKPDVADGYKWQCPKCKTFESVRRGKNQAGQQTFFHNSKVSL